MTTFNYTMTVNVQMNVDPRSHCQLFLGCRVEYSYKIVDVGQILKTDDWASLHSRDPPLLPGRIKIKVNAAETAHCKSVQIFPQIISVPCSCSQWRPYS